MSPATKEPTEVYYPKWLDTRLARSADAVDAATNMVRREDTFLSVMEGSAGDGEATADARAVWGAERVLEDVHERLSSIRLNPSHFAHELDGLVVELWGAGYRLSAAAIALRQPTGRGENAEEVITVIETLADGLIDLGRTYDDRQARVRGAIL